MDTLSYKTVSAKNEEIKRNWVLIDAENETVGRLCSNIAYILKGKNKINFTPHIDCGDNVIVINAEKVRFTGKKIDSKEYIRHTGYPGGQRFATPRQVLQTKPEKVVEYAVKGMLPKNKLGNAMYRKLFVYAGTEHPHEAQQPKKISLKDIK